MSYAGEVKAELCRGKLSRKCCALAEAAGVLLYCSRFDLGQVRIVTESGPFAQRLPLLFKRAFGARFDRTGDPDAPGKQVFALEDPERLRQIWDQCAFDPSDPAHHINFGLLEEDHALLLDLGYEPKITERKGSYVTYFKQSEAIEDLLTAIGAPVSAMELMNAKAEKLLRNGVNRRVNCEAANVEKTVDAALEQRRAIRTLRERGVLKDLSPKLKEAARLREENPELSLSQLAELCEPKVTKSSLNHRLQKLIALSREEKEG